ncbi:ankyrin repeat domain-containing protein [Haloferula sp.]|uniref:ankyrin repeat domain-containing protein n=1 Tax=Haloferula sp. TaxID=2497595 RepID=UPI00329AF037
MKRLLLPLLALPLLGAEPDLSEQLRDALYTEEVTRDPAKAAKTYEKILTDFDQQRPIAASALFRLAEVRRNADDKDAAIALYQRLLREFSEFERESELAHKHLANLGGEIPEAGEASPEDEELAQLKQLKKTAPDIFLAPVTLTEAVSSGHLPPIRFLLENGADPNADGVLSVAVSARLFEICKLLFEHGCHPGNKESGNAIAAAINTENLPLLRFLLDQNISPNSTIELGSDTVFPINFAIRSGRLSPVELLTERGSSIDSFDRSGPNSAESTPLHTATYNGNIEAARLLLKLGAKPDLPSPDLGVTPLHLAIGSSHENSLALAELLLKHAANPNLKTLNIDPQKGSMWPDVEELKAATPLDIALRTNQHEKIAPLAAAGIDLSSSPENCVVPDSYRKGGQPLGPPLMTAIENNQPEMIDALLSAKVDVNSKADPTGYTALHLAVQENDVALTKRLLEAGADPNAATSFVSTDSNPMVKVPGVDSAKSNHVAMIPGTITPLHIVARQSGSRSLQILNLLLAAKANPNQSARVGNPGNDERFDSENADHWIVLTPLTAAGKQPDKIKTLLAAGAKATPKHLRQAALKREADIFKLLLNSLPRFDENDKSATELLELVAKGTPGSNIRRTPGQSSPKPEVDISLLIAHGAKPSKEWLQERFEGARSAVQQALNESFLYPELAEEDQIWLIQPRWWNRHQIITDLNQESGPITTSLARALLDSDLLFDHFNGKELEVKWTHWRKQDDGQMKTTELDLTSDAELPKMKKGDIIELITLGRPTAQHGANNRSIQRRSAATDWNLLRRISFPIKVTRGDVTSEIIVRGDCLTYNPKVKIAPLFSAGHLAQLLFPDEHNLPLKKPLQVIVHRDDWNPIRLSNKTKEWANFPLEPNDRVAIEALAADEDDQLTMRKSQIRLVVPGTHFSHYQMVNHDTALLPTLSEMVTTTYAAWNSYKPAKFSDFSTNPQTRFGEIAIAIREKIATIPIHLPHPDLAGIRIRRIEDDGSEKIITPRLAENISNFTEEASYEQLHAAETKLLPGDIVELPLKESSEAWTGFSEEASRYFHRLLSGAFLFTDGDREISRKTINWQPAELLKTPCGPIPFQPKTGTTSTTAFALGIYFSHLELHRGDKSFSSLSPRNFFVRDGDQLAPPSQPTSRQPTTPAPTTQKPRVRRVPTPPSR